MRPVIVPQSGRRTVHKMRPDVGDERAPPPHLFRIVVEFIRHP